MKHARRGVHGLIAGLVGGLPGIAQIAHGQSDTTYPELTIPFQAEAVTDTGVFYFQGMSGVPDNQNQGFTANAGFVITEDSVVVFDALGTPSLGAAMIEKIRDTSPLPISHVVVSHYHADHVYGLQAFKELTEAKVVAHQHARHYLDSPDANQRLSQRQEALAPWVNDSTRIIGPDMTFESHQTFESGSYQFSLVHAGPAHASDDTLMMVQPAGVLFSGDIIQNGRIPYLASSEVDSANWLNAIERVRELAPTYLVPGHGPASSNAMEALQFTHDYLSFVREEMGNAVDNWIPFEDAYEQTDWSRYETMPAFDASNKANAYRVFLEMEKAALGGG
ncbi:MBL fold metallo-hydrolase [Marinobacter salinisoli]|uniref:MBL fold metallo-hydrolase n=1 Tax=Marinobacter salinisoli TaxID=2769486 RepID=A0ABX7MS06_9GAMM|nr:MBL fold metallo-hydrolase [Marinobacter salinisoli]QSP93881.1 MBL fold metallo-hydrolase [Marinobacter salinisoli]